jgi:hypothetical protein
MEQKTRRKPSKNVKRGSFPKKKRISRKKPMGGVFTAIKTIEGYARAGGEWVDRHERTILLSIETLLIAISAYHYWRLDLERAKSQFDKRLVKTTTKQTQVTSKIVEGQEKVIKAIGLQAKTTMGLAMQQDQIRQLVDLGLAANTKTAKEILALKNQVVRLKNKTSFVDQTLNSKEFKEFIAKRLKLKDIKKK